MTGDQLTFMPEHRNEPPGCYQEVAEAIQWARDNWDPIDGEDLDQVGPLDLSFELVEVAGIGKGYTRQDVERCIRIFREREAAEKYLGIKGPN